MNSNEINSQLSVLYDSQFQRIYSFFYFKTLSKDIAEDLTSDTFLTLANILSNNKKEINNLNSFLYGIAKNIFIKYLQKKYIGEIPFSNFAEDFEEYTTEFVSEREKREPLEDKLRKYIHLIPEKQAKILELRFLEKLSLTEIALKLNKNMNYVKTTQKRALKSLREAIEANP